MKLRISLFLLLLCFGFLGTAFAQFNFGTPAANKELIDHKHPTASIVPEQNEIRFIRNDGQWEDQVLYSADLKSGRLFMEDDQLTYVFWDNTDLHDRFFHSTEERRSESFKIDCHAFRMNLVGAHSLKGVQNQNKSETYHNYFMGKDPAKWASEVPLFGEIIYEGVYENIDMVFFGLDKSLKYEFHVAPGADPQQIGLNYDGLKEIALREGDLHLITTVNAIIEQAPYAYQLIDGQEVEVPCNFVLEGENVHFEFPDGYDNHHALVIDPTLIFSGYTGSTADNFGYTATYDTSGALYAGGIAFGLGYPTTVGAYQVGYGGGGSGGAWSGVDISITKINSTGTAFVYSTYLGGSDNEQPHSLITNEAGELFVYGVTYSSDYPVSTGAVGGSLTGAADIIVSRFDAAGASLIASTYVGGTDNDGVNINTAFTRNSLKYNYGDDARGEIMLDNTGNVYIASSTQSINFPTTPGALQLASGGAQDAVVFKLNPTFTTFGYSTYLGGTGNDAGYSLKVNSAGEVFVTGGTESNNFPTTTGSLDETYGGAIDGYVSRINASGTALVASSFLGTAAYDQSYFLQLDDDEEVYVLGQTLGPWTVTPGVYSNANGRQFIQKMNPALNTVVFSTVFGKGAADVDVSPTAFLVDICEYIYLSGWGGLVNFGGNTTGMPLTADAFQSTTDGSDLYLMVLERDAVALEYGSYFGGATSREHVDGGTSRFNRQLEIYQSVCAGCGGNDDFPYFPASGGALSNTNNSFNCNLGAFKMAFTPHNIEANFTSLISSGCAPFFVDFTNTSIGGVSYFWDFGDGTTDTIANPTHTYADPGTYEVLLVVTDSLSCNVVDSVLHTVTVLDQPVAVVSGDVTSCDGGSVTLNASGGDHYLWFPSSTLSNDTIPNPVASPTVTTTYTVIVTNAGGCADTATITVTISNFLAEAGPPSSFCEGTGGVQLFGGALGGTAPYYYHWWCDSTSTYCGIDSVFDDDPFVNPTTSTMYYLQITDATGCVSEIDSVFVTILPVPIADAGLDTAICSQPAPGIILNGTVSGAPGPYLYSWSPAAGLSDTTIANPYARPDTTTIYTLIVTSSNGCTSERTTLDTVSTVMVKVHPQPIADAGPDIHLCFGDTTMLVGTGINAGPDYNFEWSPSETMDDSTRSNPTVWPTLTTEYSLMVWSNGCPSVGDTAVVFVHTLPTIDAGPDREICLADSVMLDGQAGGDSTATYSYQWFPPIGLNDPDLEDPMASPDSTRTYYLVSTSSYGCISPADSVLVTILPTPIAEAGPPQTICFGDTVQLLGSYYYSSTDSASDTTAILYGWSPSTGVGDITIPQPFLATDSSGWYYLTVDHGVCSTTDSVLVTVIPELGTQAWADTLLSCQGDSVRLYASGGLGGANYTWIPSTSLSDPDSSVTWAAPDETTTYSLVLSEQGCFDTLELELTILPTPDVSYLTSQTEGCVDLEVSFLETASDDVHYIWNFGDGSAVSNDPNPTHTYTIPGEYQVTLTVISPGGCTDTAMTTTIHAGKGPTAAFITAPEVPATLMLPNTTVKFTDRSANASSWLWDFGDGSSSTDQNPSHFYTQEGEFMTTLKVGNNGCYDEITQGPFVVIAPGTFIPNVFSPNGDGISDLYLTGYTGDQPFSIVIRDRWGNLMFSTENKLLGWDGTTNGNQAQEGVYFYVIRIGQKTYNGEITLVR